MGMYLDNNKIFNELKENFYRHVKTGDRKARHTKHMSHNSWIFHLYALFALGMGYAFTNNSFLLGAFVSYTSFFLTYFIIELVRMYLDTKYVFKPKGPVSFHMEFHGQLIDRNWNDECVFLVSNGVAELTDTVDTYHMNLSNKTVYVKGRDAKRVIGDYFYVEVQDDLEYSDIVTNYADTIKRVNPTKE